MRSVLSVVLLAVALPAFGQFGNGPFGRNGGGWNRGRLGETAVIDRTASDLRRIAGRGGYIDNGNRKRLERALNDLNRFEYNFSHGSKFDRGRLDSAIGNIDHVVRNSRIDGRDRDVLSRDLIALRDFRNNGGGSYGRRW